MDTYVYSDKDREEDFPAVSDETAHYMESTSRLRAENEKQRALVSDWKKTSDSYANKLLDAEATMREVASQLRTFWTLKGADEQACEVAGALADRLDPPTR